MMIVPAGTTCSNGNPLLTMLELDDPYYISTFTTFYDALKKPLTGHCIAFVDDEHLLLIQPGPKPLMGLFNMTGG